MKDNNKQTNANGIIKYANIQYGTAKRFEEPVLAPLQNEDITKYIDGKATKVRVCPQFLQGVSPAFGFDPYENSEVSEDCLYLSIIKPKKSFEEDYLPVMVWIHGGGYIEGGGAAKGFEVDKMAMEQDIMIVQVNYRLGVFGFLGGYNNIPTNLGLLDVLTALNWIQKHIKLFGGNPNQVTLFGQSAGADLIAHLLLIDGSEKLFSRVILQSPPLGLRKNKDALTEKMIEVGKKSNMTDSPEKILDIQKEMIESVRSMGLQAGMPFGVQYGNGLLPAFEDVELRWKQRAKYFELMIGYNKDETAFFIPFIKEFKKYIDIPIIGKLIKKLIVFVTTKQVYSKEIHNFYKNYKKGNSKIRLYRLDFGSKTNGYGAAHTIDLPLLFYSDKIWGQSPLLKDIPKSEVKEVSKMIQTIWCDFAKYGVNFEYKKSPCFKIV